MGVLAKKLLHSSEHNSFLEFTDKPEEDLLEEQGEEIVEEEKKLSLAKKVLQENSFDGSDSQIETESPAVDEGGFFQNTIVPALQSVGENLSDLKKQLGVTPLTALVGGPQATADVAASLTDPKNLLRGAIGAEPAPPPRSFAEFFFGKDASDPIKKGIEKIFKSDVPVAQRPLVDPFSPFFAARQQGTPFDEPFVRKKLEGITGADLEPKTPLGKIGRAVTTGAAQSPFTGIPTGIAALIPGVEKTLEEVGAPKIVQTIGGVTAAVIAGRGGGKKAAPLTQAEAKEIIRNDPQAKRILKPKIELMDTAERLGVELPPYLLSESDLVQGATFATAKSQLAKKKFNASMESVGKETEVAFQKSLDSIAEKSFEGPAQLELELKQAERPRQKARSKTNEKRIDEVSKQFVFETSSINEARRLAEEHIQSIDKRMANNTLEFPNPAQSLEKEISRAPFRTKTELGGGVQESLNQAVNVQKKVDNARYDKARDLQPPVTILPTELLEFTNDVLETLDTPGPKGTSTAKTIRAFKDIEKAFSDGEGSIQPATVNDITNVKINLGELANYDVVGGSVKFIEKGAEVAVKELERLSQEFPQWWNAFREAETGFEEGAKTFRNDTIKNARLGTPETILESSKTPSKFLQIQDALQLAEDGFPLSQELKRQVLRDVMGPKLMEAESIADVSKLMDATKREQLTQLDPIFDSIEKDILKETQALSKKLSSNQLKMESIRKSVLTDLEKMQLPKEPVGEPIKINPITIDMLNTPLGIKKLRGELNSTAKGRELMKSLERFKAEEILGDSLFDQFGEMKLGKINDAINDRTKREILKTILPEKAFNDLKGVGKISSELIRVSKELSRFQGRGFPGAFAVHQLLSGNVAQAAKILGLKKGAQAFGVKFLTDPKNLALMVKLTREKALPLRLNTYKKLGQSLINSAAQEQ